MTTTLGSSSGYLVLINTVTVEPDRAEDLLANLHAATENGWRRLPGLCRPNRHFSHDRTHVAN